MVCLRQTGKVTLKARTGFEGHIYALGQHVTIELDILYGRWKAHTLYTVVSVLMIVYIYITHFQSINILLALLSIYCQHCSEH